MYDSWFLMASYRQTYKLEAHKAMLQSFDVSGYIMLWILCKPRVLATSGFATQALFVYPNL